MAAGRSPPHPALRATFPPRGKVQRVQEAVPYKETGAISPPVSLRSTASLPPLAFGHFPLTGGIGPRQRGPKRTPPQKASPLAGEVAPPQAVTEGVGGMGRSAQAEPYMVRTIRRGRCPHRPAAGIGPGAERSEADEAVRR